ncbi:MAG: SDR family NAD(P)-dependent oxidoreductase [Actinomycetota bacterium]|nr:SDR family NAD(P)-dependent oxidoreductase [Actinomycetota bacterium]
MSRYELAGRTVVLTGSSGGLGTALAEALRACGANLALLDVNLDSVATQARALGGDTVARGWRADVRHLDDLEAAMAAAADHFGHIDIVIANGGVGTIAPMAIIDPAAHERVIDINLNGVWRTFRAALPYVQRHQGYLLAISSMAAFVHSPLVASYTASKAGIWALCGSIRLEVRHLGVGVGSAHPTFFRTPMTENVVTDPARNVLWGGNEKGLWKMVPLATVTDGIVNGIQRRADLIVVPKRNLIVAKAPGIFRPLIERLGFRGSTLLRALQLASSADRHDREADGRPLLADSDLRADQWGRVCTG